MSHSRGKFATVAREADRAEWISVAPSNSAPALPVFTDAHARSLARLRDVPVFSPTAGFTSLR